MYFSRDGDDYIEIHDTAEEARKACERDLAEVRETASFEGWKDEEVTLICWGEMTIKQSAVKCDVRKRPDTCGTEECELKCGYDQCEFGDWDETYNYKLEDYK